jgi:hypothetical protein
MLTPAGVAVGSGLNDNKVRTHGLSLLFTSGASVRASPGHTFFLNVGPDTILGVD